jgi:protein-S-isoprenylcysteine O-methyltransferase Ste14
VRTLIYSDPLAAGIYWATYLAFILIDARLVTDVMRGRTAARATSAQGAVHRPVGILWLVGGEALGLAAAFIDALVLPGPWVFLVVGVVLAWSGILIRVAAKRTLGRFFVGAVLIQDDHRVVTDGPYALVRHPGAHSGGRGRHIATSRTARMRGQGARRRGCGAGPPA